MLDLCNEILHANGFRTLIISGSIDVTQVEMTDHFQAYYTLRTKHTIIIDILLHVQNRLHTVSLLSFVRRIY